MKWPLLMLALLLLPACSFNQLQNGEERWNKFIDLEPEALSEDTPTISTQRGTYKSGERLVIEVTAGDSTHFYVFLMLPNNDIYLLTPSSIFKDHRGKTVALAPGKHSMELFVPDLVGTVHLGVIVSPQNLNILSEGWLPVQNGREFDTWPADLAFDRALDFMEEAFDEKPWALANSSFVISKKN
jgi:hypothetical protein